ncbi:MAG: serine/threonine protein kinase [Planctomycetes bacterium]|nr:serine/threonine protein kinase [Planctomycetota bacterium]
MTSASEDPRELESRWDTGMSWAFTAKSPTDQRGELRTALPDRLVLEGEVARGGVGIVLAAHDRVLGRDVAVKILRDRYASMAGPRRRFVTEACITSQLQHPGVVPIYDMGLDEREWPWFTMKLVKGRSFADVLADRSPGSPTVHGHLATFLQICRTVAYAHAHGIIHRDLKPKNVMVGDFGEVLVMDWGLAKRTNEHRSDTDPDFETEPVEPIPRERATSHDVTLEGSALGTPAYMSPEQARGEIDLIDARSDVFALGSILLEILSGKPVHGGDEALSDAKNATQASVDARLSGLDVDRDLVAIARDCLAVDLDRRLTDAGHVKTRIEAHLDHLADRAQRAEIEAATAKAGVEAARRSRRLVVALVTAAFAVVTLIVSFLLWRSGENARMERDIAVAVQEAERQEARGEFEQAIETLLRTEGLIRASGIDTVSVESIQSSRSALEARVRDAELGDLYDRIRSDPDPGPRRIHEYERHFHQLGVDLRQSDAATMAKALEQAGPESDVVLAIEDWAFALAQERPDSLWPKLLRVADILDPVPTHMRIRGAATTGDRTELAALVHELPPATTASRTCLLLARAIELRDALGARDFLENVVVEHRSDFWVHFALAILYRRVEPVQPDASELHARLAEALHKKPEWRMFGARGRRRGR